MVAIITWKALLPQPNWGMKPWDPCALPMSTKNVNDEVNPHRGIIWKNELGWTSSMASKNIRFYSLKSELSVFVPIRLSKKQSTLALRTGWAQQ